jgi:hypothetical protein
MNDLPALVASWRAYRRMLADGIEPRAHYERLINDLAVVIRRRLGYEH